MPRQQLADRTGMAGKDPKVLVRNEQVDHPVVRVALEHPFDAFQRDAHGFGREGGRLAESAAEAAAPRGEQQAEADDFPKRHPERDHHRRMD